MQDTKIQNSLKIDTCFWGFKITPKFSETQVFQDIILYPSASGKIHSEYLLGLVYNHFGRPAKQSHERGGTSICGLPYVCVTQHDMLFASLTLEQGIKLNLHLWKMTVFYFIFTDWKRGSDFFPWEPLLFSIKLKYIPLPKEQTTSWQQCCVHFCFC